MGSAHCATFASHRPPSRMHLSMSFARFKLLTFDVMGTLIDFEAGILAYLRNIPCSRASRPADAMIHEAFARSEERRSGAIIRVRGARSRRIERHPPLMGIGRPLRSGRWEGGASRINDSEYYRRSRHSLGSRAGQPKSRGRSPAWNQVTKLTMS